MRFRKFLEGVGPTDMASGPVTKAISESAAIEWLKMNAPEFTKKAQKREILRGMKRVDSVAQLGDTSTFQRKSMNAKNYYMLLINSSGRWKDYPSRASAFVGTTEAQAANTYGEIFIVFPADTAKIGICPKYDMWQSFHKPLGQIRIHSLRVLCEFLDEISGADGKSFSGTDADELRSQLRWYTEENLRGLLNTPEFERFSRFRNPLTELIYLMGEHHWDNLEKALDEILDPNDNDFHHCTAHDWSVHAPKGEHEVWIEGQVLFLPSKWFSKTATFYSKFKEEFGWE